MTVISMGSVLAAGFGDATMEVDVPPWASSGGARSVIKLQQRIHYLDI